MKKLLLLFLFYSCSDKPVDMENVLYDRSGQYITGDNFSPYFFFNQKVYNGPAFNKYKSGEKREQGLLKNGYKDGLWTGWNKDGKKRFTGEYKEGKANENWIGYHPNGKKKYEGKYEQGLQTGKWIYYNNKGVKEMDESYFVCTDKCKDSHPPDKRGTAYICKHLGRVINPK
jgi:antitoxin component YwqK of YwqJK toxin-antitoxin module|tara:strand:- start:2049 stop:2564 length:516 start_codon:yes stop_codon:yes gene_type:complete